MTSSTSLSTCSRPGFSQLDDVLLQIRPRVKRVVLKKLGRVPPAKIDASDIVQLAFERVFLHFADFKGTTRKEFDGWVFRIAVNLVRDHIKFWSRGRRDMRVEQSIQLGILIAESLERASKVAEDREQFAIVMNRLHSLPVNQRTAVTLRHLRQMKVREIAACMNLSEDAVAGLLRRGMKRLQQAISSG